MDHDDCFSPKLTMDSSLKSAKYVGADMSEAVEDRSLRVGSSFSFFLLFFFRFFFVASFDPLVPSWKPRSQGETVSSKTEPIFLIDEGRFPTSS